MVYSVTSLDGYQNGVQLYDASGNIITVVNGAALPTSPGGLFVLGSDGANARIVKTAADGTVYVNTSGNGLALDATLQARLNTLGQKTMASSTPVVLASDQSAVPASQSGTWTNAQGSPAALSGAWPIKHTDGSNVMPTMDAVGRAGFVSITDGANKATVNANGQLQISEDNANAVTIELAYDQSVNVAGAQAGMWGKGIYYTIPSGNKFTVGLVTIFAANTSASLRLAKFLVLANFNTGTLTGTANLNAYTSPSFASDLEAEVTTTTANTNATVVTITYTNQSGVTGQTTTVTIPKAVPAGYKIPVNLAGSDFGVRAVTAISGTGTNTGAININGLITLIQGSVSVANQSSYISPAAGSMVARPSDVLALDYLSSAAATAERMIRVVGKLDNA